jgi:hypothetical protein
VRGFELTPLIEQLEKRAARKTAETREGTSEPARPTPAKIRVVADDKSAQAAINAPETPWTMVALVGANIVPLAGVLFLGWDLGTVMLLFWAENAVIGFYNLLKLAVVAKWGFLFVGPFFLGHYGGFMAGHFMFVYYLFVRGLNNAASELSATSELLQLAHAVWPALAMLLISHGISFRMNFVGKREFEGRTVNEQMSEPYKRIMILHVTIIFGGWIVMLLGNAVGALLFLVIIKTIVDLAAHRKEHART